MKELKKQEIKYITIMLFVFIVIGVIINNNISNFIRDSIINERLNILSKSATEKLSHANISKDVFLSPVLNIDHLALEELSKELSIGDVVKTKIFNLRREIIHSDEEELIGQKKTQDPKLELALKGKMATNIVGNEKYKELKENLLEIYVPIIYPGDTKPSGVIELYYKMDSLNNSVFKYNLKISIIFIITFFLLLIILLYILKKFTNKIEKLHEEDSKNLEKIADLKDEFVFVASHELRAPVTAINWGLNSIVKKFENNKLSEKDIVEVKDDLSDVFKANNRLLALVNDLLSVSRAEKNKIKTQTEPVNIVNIINDAISEQEGQANNKNILIKYIKPKRPIMVKADSYKLKEVIINIINNSIKYSKPEKSIKIYHNIKNKHIITSIKDNGMGISEEDKKNLFTKFWRSKKVKNIEGTGLGLFIIKKLVKMMNGKIWVESKEKVGTTISFKLSRYTGGLKK